jgi:Cytotoxic
VPGYNPAVPPTREQLIQAGIAQQQHLRDLRATGEVTDDPGWLDRHLPHVPDAHKVFGDLSYVPFPEIGSAAALTDAYAYYTEGRTKEAGEALLGVVPMGKYLGPLGKGAKVAGEFVLGESRAEPKPAPGIRPPDPEAGPAAQPRPEPAPKPAAPKPADDPGQPAGAPAPHLVPRPGVGQPKSDAPGAPAGATPRGGVGRGPAGEAGKAPTGNAGAGPRGRANPRATGRDDTTPPNAMAGARPGGPTKGEPLTNSANSNRRGPAANNTPNDTPPATGPGRRGPTRDGTPPQDTGGTPRTERKGQPPPGQTYHPTPKLDQVRAVFGKDLQRVQPKTPVQGGGSLRPRWKDRKGGIYEFDLQHGTIEKYNKTGRKHLGEYDLTGKQTKGSDPNRRVEP